MESPKPYAYPEIEVCELDLNWSEEQVDKLFIK